MSGPPYPPPPGGQSNEIGEFQVGISPIGTLVQFNFWQTIISQYANSDVLVNLIADFDSWADQTQNFDSFYSNVWNIETAVGYGLDLWGRIVGIPRNVLVTESAGYFAFDDPARGFDNPNAPIYTSGPLTKTVNVSLSNDDYRNLLLAKAATNICDGSVAGIMSAYNKFFGNYNTPIFINENNSTRMSYDVCQVGYAISLTNLAILSNGSLPLKPAGVAANYYVVSKQGPMFGFDMENDQVAGWDHGMIGMSPLQYVLASV